MKRKLSPLESLQSLEEKKQKLTSTIDFSECKNPNICGKNQICGATNVCMRCDDSTLDQLLNYFGPLLAKEPLFQGTMKPSTPAEVAQMLQILDLGEEIQKFESTHPHPTARTCARLRVYSRNKAKNLCPWSSGGLNQCGETEVCVPHRTCHSCEIKDSNPMLLQALFDQYYGPRIWESLRSTQESVRTLKYRHVPVDQVSSSSQLFNLVYDTKTVPCEVLINLRNWSVLTPVQQREQSPIDVFVNRGASCFADAIAAALFSGNRWIDFQLDLFPERLETRQIRGELALCKLNELKRNNKEQKEILQFERSSLTSEKNFVCTWNSFTEALNKENKVLSSIYEATRQIRDFTQKRIPFPPGKKKITIRGLLDACSVGQTFERRGEDVNAFLLHWVSTLLFPSRTVDVIEQIERYDAKSEHLVSKEKQVVKREWLWEPFKNFTGLDTISKLLHAQTAPPSLKDIEASNFTDITTNQIIKVKRIVRVQILHAPFIVFYLPRGTSDQSVTQEGIYYPVTPDEEIRFSDTSRVILQAVVCRTGAPNFSGCTHFVTYIRSGSDPFNWYYYDDLGEETYDILERMSFPMMAQSANVRFNGTLFFYTEPEYLYSTQRKD